MNNKKGGFGARLLLVLILMIASAVGGAYAYRVFDGKMAVSDAKKTVDAVRVSDYDTTEAVQIETYKEDATKSLETAVTRKQVYEILEDFDENVDKVMTKTEKELAEAREAARNAANNSNNNNNNNTISNNSNIGNNGTGGTIVDPSANNGDSTLNNDTQAEEQKDNSSGGLFGGLLGGNKNDSTNDDTQDEDNDIFN